MTTDMPAEPDDLDRMIAEEMKDPAFIRAWMESERQERLTAVAEAYERGISEGRRQAAVEVRLFRDSAFPDRSGGRDGAEAK